ncbi:hypothetical protein BDB00DRAFT_821992 [Zychaea mexicana]|uniref:uncharacterized protein n=1 Tax=Zychaea mexicana TaxID=64656 RepID=UPI0022FE579E|nr:uncharacterized protein BDB00DRAFT_821992 [Zychaea mexicana]KAI9493652.1 hypothetical protein BDB00DRAFT_821992 [Zychaea mexicana]
MLICLSLITSWAIGKKQQEHQQQNGSFEHQHYEKKTTMISAKPGPVIKTTNVHVAADQGEADQDNSPDSNHKFIDEKPTAKIALSVELAKQQHQQHRWPGIRAESIMSKASVESLHRIMQTQQQQQQPGDETTKSIYQQQQQWNYSAKAMPDTFSTRVSANGSVALSDSDSATGVAAAATTAAVDEQYEDHSPPQSPAVARLIKQHRQATILSETGSLFSSNSSDAVMTKSGATIDQQRILETAAARGKEPCDQPNVTNDEGVSVVQTTGATISDASSMTAPATVITSSGATTTAAPTSAPSYSCRNVVLPVYESRFAPPTLQQQQQPQTPYAIGSILESTFSSFSSIFSNNQQTTSHEAESWTKSLQDKFSKIVSPVPKVDSTTHMHKKFAVVGIHGWFPTKLVRSMIGEPTGTSQKFCKQMMAALEQYLKTEHQLTLSDDAVTVIPLEGEGKVEERIHKLFLQLVSNLEWLEAISSADIILWGTHSQGTPVSVMLLHQLLQGGHIHLHRQSVCMLAMAGIGHGPFPSLQGSLIVKYFEADAARELFDFMDSNSVISQKFRESLGSILNSGVKMVLVGSLQDQVVPLYSAILAGVSHPNILRAVYIDKHVYTDDDFLINLVVFALRLRNAGIPDHGLLIHVSEVLAGSIYAFEGGHSTIYEEVDVYMLAVRYLFDTPGLSPLSTMSPPSPQKAVSASSSSPVQASIQQSPSNSRGIPLASQQQPQNEEALMDPFKAELRLNPYYLPWVLRGIFEDAAIIKVGWASQELGRLHELFLRWAPTSAKLREFKFRLEPLKDHIFGSS